MTYNDILRLYPALSEFSALKLPVKKAWHLWQMISDIKVRYEFYCAEEMKLATKYAICADGKPIVTKNGQISFSSDENQRKYEREIAALKASDAGHVTPLDIYISELGDQSISAEIISRLSPEIKIIPDKETAK